MKAKLDEWTKFKFNLDQWKSVLSSSVKDKPNEGKTTATTNKEVTEKRSTKVMFICTKEKCLVVEANDLECS